MSYGGSDGTHDKPVGVYYADETAPALACKIQYQTCDPKMLSEQGCSSWGGTFDINFGLTPPKTKKERIMSWSLNALTSLDDVILGLKASALTSRFRLIDGIQASLPADQWQLEVENWHSISLAALQGGLIDIAAGPGDPMVLRYFWARPSNTEEKYLCQNQVSKAVHLCSGLLEIPPAQDVVCFTTNMSSRKLSPPLIQTSQ